MSTRDAGGEGIDGRPSAASADRHARQQRARSRQFIRGPLPMAWFEAAAAAPGKTLAVALLVWFRRGMKGDGPFPLSIKLLTRFGVTRKAGYAALRRLENSGLVRVDRGRGRLARVTVVAAPSGVKGRPREPQAGSRLGGTDC